MMPSMKMSTKSFVNSSNLQERSCLSKAVQKDFNLLNNKVNQNQSNFTPFANQDLVSTTNRNQKPKSNRSEQTKLVIIVKGLGDQNTLKQNQQNHQQNSQQNHQQKGLEFLAIPVRPGSRRN